MTKEDPILSDPKQYPSDEIVFSHIGRKKDLWARFFDDLKTDHPDFSKEWRYYKDGGRWLMKVTRKAKTIFWVSVEEKEFLVTFYFSDKASASINDSSLSSELKEAFNTGKRYGKIRGITVSIAKFKDIEYVNTLIEIRKNV